MLGLLDEHGASLHRHLGRLTRCEHTTGDLMQELFLKLADSKGFAAADNGYAYAWRAATNLALDWRRKRARQSAKMEVAAEPREQNDSALLGMIRDERVERVLDATARLKEPGRSVIVMRYVEEQPHDVIAERLGMKVNYVRSLCSKALGRLRKMLNSDHSAHGDEEVRCG